MRLEVDHTPSVVPPQISENLDSNSESDVARSKEALNEGVRAAQSGDREHARTMLLQATKLDARNENAWLWLASISEYPEELMAFLENVLSINPNNERALQWKSATKTLLSKTFAQRGVDAAEADQAMYAEDCFRKALEYDDQNASAWLWLASLSKDAESRKRFLERVLAIDPENQAAHTAMRSMSDEEERSAFAEIKNHALEGKAGQALDMLEDFTSRYANNVDAWMLRSHLSTKPADKLAALKRVLEIAPDNEAARLSYETLSEMFGEVENPAPEPPAPVVEFEESPVEETAPEIVSASSFPEFESAQHYSIDPFETIAQIPLENIVEFHEVDEPAEAPIGKPPETLEFELSDEYVREATPEADTFAAPAQNFDEPEEDWSRETVAYDLADLIPADEEPVSTAANWTNGADHAIPIPYASLDEENQIQPERTGFETQVERKNADTVECPYCSNANESNAFVCRSCSAALTLADLELLLNNNGADRHAIRQAIDQMESDRASGEFTSAELVKLGIAHLNLRNLMEGYDCLQKASQLDPENIVLSSQVNALHIRVEEIRWQDEVHASMVKGKTILVVDDSPTVRKLISGKLEKSGHQVFCSADGVEAMERLRELVPDLVLLDISMPRMDGYQVCRQIRGNSATANIPVVMISGKDGFFDKVRGRMAGTTGYITKPFGPETLMKAVEYYLSGGTGPDEFMEPTEELL